MTLNFDGLQKLVEPALGDFGEKITVGCAIVLSSVNTTTNVVSIACPNAIMPIASDPVCVSACCALDRK